MPCLKYIVQHAENTEYKLLRGKTIECISLIGLAVGRDKVSHTLFKGGLSLKIEKNYILFKGGLSLKIEKITYSLKVDFHLRSKKITYSFKVDFRSN